MRWWNWLAAAALLLGLAGCVRENRTARLNAINDQMLQDPIAALPLVQDYVNDYPAVAAGWRVLGWTLLKSETDDAGARDAFNRALELDPEDDNSYVGLGAYYRRTNDLATANEMYLKAVELNPDNPEAYGSMVGVDLMRQDFAAAVTHGEKAWQLDSTNATVAANLAVAYHFNGEYEKRDVLLASAESLGYANMQDLHDLFSE
jgi:Flp pilus assembly protein TadD